MNWVGDLQQALHYIEENLTGDLSNEKIAQSIYSSNIYFQKIFNIVTRMPLGEYVRNRRLSCAGEDLLRADSRIADIAYRYGYESADSFSKAFTRFHGIPPSAARESGEGIRRFDPLVIHINIKGGFKMSSTQSSVTLEKVEFIPFGPCRMIGKSVCAKPASGDIFGALWGDRSISEALDAIADQAYDENLAGYMTMAGTQDDPMLWYTVGRFMKPGTPVPDGFKHYDIPETIVCSTLVKGKFDDMIDMIDGMTMDAIFGQKEYVAKYPDGYFFAEIYTPNTIPDEHRVSELGYIVACERNPEL